MSIEALPVGANTVSFAWGETAQGIEYDINAQQAGWSLIVRADTAAGAKYYLNGAPIAPTASGIRMSGTRNHLLVVPRK